MRGTQRPKDSFFLRAESYFNVATEIEQLGVLDAYGGRSLHEQSHGESFLALLHNRFRGGGFYVLDEPEAALSPARQLAFLARLHALVQLGSQFLIATHSPIVMAYPQARILALGASGIVAVPYEDTEHYQVSRAFLLRREPMPRELLGEDEPNPD